MFSKMTKVLMLSGCLLTGGVATAGERNVIVPVIAGAAVGAILATALSHSSQERHRPQHQRYRPQPYYRPQYQEVRYVPVRRAEYRRYGPAPRSYYDRGHHRDYDHGRGNARW